MKKIATITITSIFVLLMVSGANASIIDFTGGTAYLVDGGEVTTDTTAVWGATDYYIEDEFVLDFIGGGGIIGDYYNAGNDVIHGHWSTGPFGSLTEIRIFKEDHSTFDLNYFELTSNTDTGGWHASGSEQTYVAAFDSTDTQIGSSVLLDPDNWGFDGDNPQIVLGSDFDNASYVSIFAANEVHCFGMDMFYINQAAPTVPEPSTILLMGVGILGLAGFSCKRFNKKS